MKYTIRKMAKEDCTAIAHVVTAAWNETYRGIVPDEFLDRMESNEKDRAENSYRGFDSNEDRQFVLEADGRIVGYMNIGMAEESGYEDCGELFAIYILREYQGYGYGKKMAEAGMQELKGMGCSRMLVGCLAGNPANGFYEHIGGKLIRQRIFEKLQLPENVYYFENI